MSGHDFKDSGMDKIIRCGVLFLIPAIFQSSNRVQTLFSVDYES